MTSIKTGIMGYPQKPGHILFYNSPKTLLFSVVFPTFRLLSHLINLPPPIYRHPSYYPKSSWHFVDFGALGIYKWNGTAWSQLSSTNPENIVASNSTLYVDFGASYGLYKWDGASWTQLSSTKPENMVTTGSTLYVDFGTFGIYKWNGSSWTQLTGSNPVLMVVLN